MKNFYFFFLMVQFRKVKLFFINMVCKYISTLEYSNVMKNE